MSSLLRSTKFVRYFTGAARTLILNTARTTENTSLINPKTLCAANNVPMRDYSTSKKEIGKEQLEPLLQRLDSEVRRFGRISKRDIDEVFDEIRSHHDITSSQSLLVIRCCGELVPEELPEQRTLLVQKIWNVLNERGIPLDISHYNALLRVYIENEHPFSPAKILEELEKKGLQPNRVTYQRLMWRYCQDGDVEGATKVLEKMRELNLPVSEPVLNALVMGHAFHGDTEGAKAVLETMAAAGLQPSNRTYTLLACGYAKQGDISGVNEIINCATEKDAYMTDKDILDIIEHLAIGGHGDKAEQLFTHLQKGMGYNQDVCNLILRLLNKGQIDTAKAVMKTMPKSTNLDDTVFKGAFFVKHLLKVCNDPEKIIRTCKEVKEENIVPHSFYIATETALQLGYAEMAQKLFKELEKEGIQIRQHYYWPLLVQKGKEGDEEGLFQILRDMSAAGQIPSGETLRDYVIPYIKKNDSPQNVILKLQLANVPTMLSARNLMIQLLESGKIKLAAEVALQYRLRGQYNLVARSLINALSKTNDVNSFVSILHVMSSKPVSDREEDMQSNDDQADEKSGIHEVGRLVKTAVKILNSNDLIESLLSDLHSKGLSIDTESAEAIQQYLDKNLNTKISELLTELTSTELELAPLESLRRGNFHQTAAQFEQLLEKVKSKGGHNIARVQKQLLTALIKENNITKLDSYLQEFKSSNFELNPTLLAQLYEFYCINGDIEKAKEYQAQLKVKHPDFVLHKYKLIVMADALIQANKFDEAIKFLQDSKPAEDLDNQNFALNSKCWQVLNTLAEKKDEAKVLSLVQTLIDNNYVEPSNVILGPSIKVFLLKEDLDGALKQFEHCCNQYRSTPWKGELMKALIMKEDASKLQWLADLSTQIHGEVNILHDLVLAFVECGRLRQARRILETPGMHTRQRRLEDACQRYVEEGKPEYLEGLLEATKELSHIDRSNIFYHLLQSYCKAGETDKALGLWTLLQEEGEIPSDRFLLHLGRHLKEKNRKIPFVMPELNKSKELTKTQTNDNRKLKGISLSNTSSKKQVTTDMDSLINQGKIQEAYEVALKSFQSGVVPKNAVMKYLLKHLAEDGQVDKIQELGKYLSDSLRRQVTYDDKLTLAKFRKGHAAQHIDSLLKIAESEPTQENLDMIVQKFPRSSALASIMDNNELTTKCKNIAEFAASKGHYIPINLLWMEYILAGKEEEATAIWNQWLTESSTILFRRLLQESHFRNEPQIIEKLIDTLKSNKLITKGSYGNAYSRLINLHLTNKKLEEAEKTLNKAIENGLTAENLNKNCLEKLQEAMKQAGREFNYFN